MANENDIPLSVSLDTSAAEKGMKDFEKQASKSVDGVEKAFDGLKTVIAGAVAFLVGRELISGFKDVVKEAAAADQNVRQLGVAFAQTGEFSDKAVSSFEEFAAGIQKTTQFSDDAVLQAAALAKNFGLTNDQAQKLTETAVNLAAATGKDLNTAVEQLGATYSGTAGKLAKTTPALKNLTEEQLKSGAAIDILNKKFQGFAEATTQSFNGAIAKTGNQFGEIAESIGKVITQNPVVLASINALGKVFGELADFIGSNKETLTDFVSRGLKAVISTIPTAIKGVALLASTLQVVVDVVAITLKGLVSLGSVVLEVTKPVRDFANVIGNVVVGAVAKLIQGVLSIADAVPGVRDALGAIGVDLDGLKTTIGEFGDGAIEKALELDTSVSDSYSKFAEEAGQAIFDFTDSAQTNVNDTLESIGQGALKLSDYSKEAVKGILSIEGGAVKVTAGIKNLSKEIDDSAERAKRLEILKGSFDKIKGAVEGLQQEIDKQVLSANELINAEFKRGDLASKNAKEELKLLGKNNEANLAIIKQYDDLIAKKKELAREKLSIADFTLSEITTAFADGVADVNSAIAGFRPDQIDFSKVGRDLGNGVVSAVKGAAESIGKVTAGDIGNALVIGGKALKGLLTGEFVKAGLDFTAQFAQIPQLLIQVFEDGVTLFQGILDKLPEAIEKVIQKLPEIAGKLADSIGTVFEKIAEKLPAIADALVKALEPLVATIFQRVIPALIKALPGVVKALADALPGILDAVLKGLPDIIRELFKAIPQIVKALADALPGIAETLAENIGPIVEAFVEGLISAAPEIVIALVDSLLVNGGLERIVKALIIAIPRVAVALVQGFVRGLGTAIVSIGQALGRAFVAAVGNIGSKWGKDFGNAISGGFKSFIAGVGQIFTVGAANLFGSISNAFTQAFGGLFGTISNAFNSIFGPLFSTIGGAFSNIFGPLFDTIGGAFRNIFGPLFDTIGGAFRSIFGDLGNTLAEGGNSIARAIEKPFNDIKEFFNNLDVTGGNGGFFSNGGKLGGPLGTIGGAISGGFKSITGGGGGFGFAEGGMLQAVRVPQGFPNDSYPARLTTDELVIDRTLTNRLDDFLATQYQTKKSEGPTISDAILTQILQVLKQPQQVSTQVVVNGRELGQTILELQRNNARLSA